MKTLKEIMSIMIMVFGATIACAMTVKMIYPESFLLITFDEFNGMMLVAILGKLISGEIGSK